MAEKTRRYSVGDRLNRASGREAWIQSLEESESIPAAFEAASAQFLLPMTSELNSREEDIASDDRGIATIVDMGRLGLYFPLFAAICDHPEVLPVAIASQVVTNMLAKEVVDGIIFENPSLK